MNFKFFITSITILFITACSPPLSKFSEGESICLNGLKSKGVIIKMECIRGSNECGIRVLFESGETQYFRDDNSIVKKCPTNY